MRRVVLCLIVAACCGCTQAGDPRARIEAAQRTTAADARAGWVRITPAGLETLPRAFLASLPAAGLSVRVPSMRQGDLSICASGDCAIALEPRRLSVSPRADGSLGLSAAVGAVASGIGVRYEQTWACAFSGRPECAVSVDTAGVSPPTLSASARIALEVDAETGIGSMHLVEPRVVEGLDGGDVTIRGTNGCGRVWCSVANVVGAQRILAAEANRALVEAIGERADALACVPCAAGCPDGTRCESGLCRRPDGACAPLPLAVAAIVSSLDGRAHATIGLAAADEASVRRGGVEVALRLAAHADRRHPCVPDVAAPAPVAVPRSVLESAPAEHAHVRAVIGERAIARTLWALHRGGLGCVDVGPEEVPQLDAAMLAIVLPSSLRLSELRLDAPRVSVRPLRPPSVSVSDDGALVVEARDVRMEIWASVDGRALRLAWAHLRARATARLEARDGALAVVLGQDAVAVEIVETASAPILGAGPTELRDTFDALSSAALGVVPEAVVLDGLPIPGRIAPIAIRSVAYEGGRALVVDLRIADR